MTRGLRAGLLEASAIWQERYAPKHFRPGAAKKYGYKRRSKAYQKRKRRVMGHGTPLVWTGESKRWVETRRGRPRISKNGSRFTARLAVKTPDYFYKYHLDRTGPDKAAEATLTTDDEADELADIVSDNIDAAMASRRGPKRKRL